MVTIAILLIFRMLVNITIEFYQVRRTLNRFILKILKWKFISIYFQLDEEEDSESELERSPFDQVNDIYVHPFFTRNSNNGVRKHCWLFVTNSKMNKKITVRKGCYNNDFLSILCLFEVLACDSFTDKFVSTHTSKTVVLIESRSRFLRFFYFILMYYKCDKTGLTKFSRYAETDAIHLATITH